MEATPNKELPRTKRTACVVCRKRKTGCDGHRPECSNCSRLGYDCHYETNRKRSGPRPGYVRHLESRLEKFEKQAKSSEDVTPANTLAYGFEADVVDPGFLGMSGLDTTYSLPSQVPQIFSAPQMEQDEYLAEVTNFMMTQSFQREPSDMYASTSSAQNKSGTTSIGSGGQDSSTWLDITGLQEPLPPQEMIDELEEGYFSILHKSFPIIHRNRYFTSTRLPHTARPELCLRYAMWASAAAVMPKYQGHKIIFYRRARDYVDQVEMKLGWTNIYSTSYLQAIVLICIFEYKSAYMGRSFLTAAKAARVATILNFTRIDSEQTGRKKLLPDAEDFIELEERRRAFWGAYSCDRFDQPWTGWSSSFNDADICTNVPCSEEAFESGDEEITLKLQEVLSSSCSKLSPFAGQLLAVALSNKVINHALQAEKDNLKDTNSAWWKKYEWLIDILSKFAEALPSHLRLPNALDSPDAVSINLSLQGNIIGLHHHVCRISDEFGLDHVMTQKAKHRCMEAAAHVSTILRMYGSRDPKYLYPFCFWNVYAACRVYAFALVDEPNDTLVQGSLDYLEEFTKRESSHNILPMSFLRRLKMDTETYRERKEKNNVESVISKWVVSGSSESPENTGQPPFEGYMDGSISQNDVFTTPSNNSCSSNSQEENPRHEKQVVPDTSGEVLDSSVMSMMNFNGFSTNNGQHPSPEFDDMGSFPVGIEGVPAFAQEDSPMGYTGMYGVTHQKNQYSA